MELMEWSQWAASRAASDMPMDAFLAPVLITLSEINVMQLLLPVRIAEQRRLADLRSRER